MEKLKSSGSLDHHIEKGTAVGEKTGTPWQTVSMSQVVQFFSSLDINSSVCHLSGTIEIWTEAKHGFWSLPA